MNAQGWADRINTDVERSAAAILKIAQDLILAKKELSHGGWERLFTGHKEAVARPILFSVRTAERLMSIAKHPILGKPVNVTLLPPDRSTLYELAALDTKVLSAALKDGRIHPGMELKDVGRLYQAAGEKVPTRFVKHRGSSREQYGGGYYAPTEENLSHLPEPEPEDKPFERLWEDTMTPEEREEERMRKGAENLARARAAVAELAVLLSDLDPAAGGTGTEWLNLRSTAEECLQWAQEIQGSVLQAARA
jgi:hypothetical protein